jgi:hypothetical protein
MGEGESGSEKSHELENLERADGGTDEPYFDGCRGEHYTTLPVTSVSQCETTLGKKLHA